MWVGDGCLVQCSLACDWELLRTGSAPQLQQDAFRTLIVLHTSPRSCPADARRAEPQRRSWIGGFDGTRSSFTPGSSGPVPAWRSPEAGAWSTSVTRPGRHVRLFTKSRMVSAPYKMLHRSTRRDRPIPPIPATRNCESAAPASANPHTLGLGRPVRGDLFLLHAARASVLPPLHTLDVPDMYPPLRPSGRWGSLAVPCR